MMKKHIQKLYFVISLLVFAFNVTQVWSEENKPILMNADDLNYNEKENIVTATGNVEVMQGETLLLADKVSYDRGKNLVKAYGNISIMQQSGDVIFGEELELYHDMKEGIIQAFSARFKDNSILAARSAQLVNDNTYQLNKAIYSPCPICENKAPQWQLKADKVVLRKDKELIEYNNAYLEVYGVPIFYTPYFNHPTIDAKRKTGLLAPKLGSVTGLGKALTLRQYINIAPNKDLTIEPTFLTKREIILASKYRHLTHKGPFNFSGSITKTKDYTIKSNSGRVKSMVRGHIEGDGNFSVTPEWDVGFRLKKASDANYLRKYDFGKEDYLTSKAYLDYRNDRNSVSIQTIYFQRLLENNPSKDVPYIFPLVESHIESEIFNNGSKFYFDNNLLSLSREYGLDSNRFSMTAGWQLPFISEAGNVFKLNASLRSDVYAISEHYGDRDINRKFAKNINRNIPEIQLDWRYPLIKSVDKGSVIVEPVGNVILSPHDKKNAKIPNEDSRYIELSDDNLFKSNKFPGLDRIESGPRSNLGLNTTFVDDQDRSINMLVGQSFRSRKDQHLPFNSGLSKNASDYLAKIAIKPIKQLDFVYRARLDKEDFAVRRNEITSSLYLSRGSITVGYITQNLKDFSLLPNKESINQKQIYLAGNMSLTPKWEIGPYLRRDIGKKQHKWIEAGGNVIYKGDCVTVTYNLRRDFTKDLAQNRRSFVKQNIEFSLKNLGQ